MSSVKHNFSGDQAGKIIRDEIVAVVNYSAGAISGAQIPPQSGVGPPQNVGIKTVFRGKSPPPSSPGGPPAVRTGMLRDSFGIVLAKKKNKGPVIAIVGTDTKYALPLDQAKNANRRRPFMQAGIDSGQPAIKERIKRMRPRLDRVFKMKVRGVV